MADKMIYQLSDAGTLQTGDFTVIERANGLNYKTDLSTLTPSSFPWSGITNAPNFVPYDNATGSVDLGGYELHADGLTLGHPHVSDGILKFNTIGSFNYHLNLKPSNFAYTFDLVLPSIQGDVNQALINDGSGNLSWGSFVSGGTIVEYFTNGSGLLHTVKQISNTGEDAIGNYSIVFNSANNSIGNDSAAFGHANTSISDKTFVVGWANEISGVTSFGCGYSNLTYNDYGFVGGNSNINFGNSSFLYSKQSLLYGDNCSVNGGYGNSLGSYSSVMGGVGNIDGWCYNDRAFQLNYVDNQTITISGDLTAENAEGDIIVLRTISSSSDIFNFPVANNIISGITYDSENDLTIIKLNYTLESEFTYLSGFQNITATKNQEFNCTITFGTCNANRGNTALVSGRLNYNGSNNSIVGGNSNRVIAGSNLLVIGDSNRVNNGNNTFVTGQDNILSGNRAIVVGKLNNSSASNSIVVGLTNTATGAQNCAIGEGNTVGSYGYAIGNSHSISGFLSAAVGGKLNIINSDSSVIIGGYSHIMNAMGSVILGGNVYEDGNSYDPITATNDNTVYVPNLVIASTPSASTSTNCLVYNVDGTVGINNSIIPTSLPFSAITSTPTTILGYGITDAIINNRYSVTGLTSNADLKHITLGNEEVLELTYMAHNTINNGRASGKMIIHKYDFNVVSTVYSPTDIGDCSGFNIDTTTIDINTVGILVLITSGTWTVKINYQINK